MESEVVIYQAADGRTKVDVRFQDENVWLTQQQMADLFATSRTNVVEHIQHIYNEGELDEDATCRNFRQVRQEGEIIHCNSIPHLGHRASEGILDQGFHDG